MIIRKVDPKHGPNRQNARDPERLKQYDGMTREQIRDRYKLLLVELAKVQHIHQPLPTDYLKRPKSYLIVTDMKRREELLTIENDLSFIEDRMDKHYVPRLVSQSWKATLISKLFKTVKRSGIKKVGRTF